jgi:methyl-accepting chemotaxis protein
MQSTQDLVLTSRETESISIEQSSSVKEIVATMEDADKLSRNISTRIAEVALVANKTTQDVQNGFTTLATNLQKMNEITEANIETIKGIKALSEKIESIWDIVNIINSIADQTKIIAFNAELEAVKAGASGKNFLIIATEIRRLADYTMDSIIETQEQISLVHTTTEKLISHFQDSLEITKKSKTFLEKNEMLLDEMKEKAEINVIDIPDVQRYKIKEGQIHNAILSLTEQLKHLLDEASLHAYDMSENIECFERLADRVAKGEV